MRLNRLLPGLLLCSSFFSYGQQQPYYNQRPEFLKANSVWAFGVNAGLDFNNGTATPIHTEMQSDEGCASVADPSTGKLLFYSNGGKVYNANHQVMPDGDSLLGNPNPSNSNTYLGYSSVQGVCIVPVINDPNKYYLFSLSGATSGGPKVEGTLFYSVVDMSMDNGLGNIAQGKKNMSLDRDTLSEAMIAIPGDNCDIWLIVHQQNEHEFKAYHITKDGIDINPVISKTGFAGPPGYSVSCMAISPDRSKIAISDYLSGATLIGKFNPATGQITDAMKIDGNAPAPYSICFSPDNSKLYMLHHQDRNLHQFDLTVYDSMAIFNSKTLIAYTSTSDRLLGSSLRLYNDTIYQVMQGFATYKGVPSLNRINQPNLLGTACNFEAKAVPLLQGVMPRNSLGNDVVFPFPADTTYALALDSIVCQPDFTLNAPQGFEKYVWEDGSTSATRQITRSGTYWLMSIDDCHSRVDTFILSGLGLLKPVINVNVHELGTTTPYSTYQWMLNGSIIPDATESKYIVSKNGNYQVIVTNEEGCIDTSEIYEVTNAEETAIPDMGRISMQIQIYPNPAIDILNITAPVAVDIVLNSIEGKTLRKEMGVKQLNLHGLAEGLYLLHIFDQDGNLLKVEKITKTY